jgi:hydrogenase/urease accessory protein HupE
MKKSAPNISFCSRLIPRLAVFLLPTLAQAHPGIPCHTHGLNLAAAATGLQLLGIGSGLPAQRFGSARLVRCAGGAIAACGVYLCFSP